MRRLTRFFTVAIAAALIAPLTALLAAPVASADPSAEDWAALRLCEASGNYAINTGNGYYGAYQFNLTTWQTVGGQGYPHEASPAEQDYRALRLYRQRGWAPWPGCTDKLGLDDSADPDAKSKNDPPRPPDVIDVPTLADVTVANTHYRNIMWLWQTGITKPVGNWFNPLGPVTRGAMVAFLFRLTHPGEVSPPCYVPPFPDVSTGNTFCGYITWAHDNGITSGYNDGTFRPSAPVTRGAMAAFLQRIADGTTLPPCEVGPYADIGPAAPFCEAITWARDNEITYGVNPHAAAPSYGPALTVNRQSMASFLARINSYMLGE